VKFKKHFARIAVTTSLVLIATVLSAPSAQAARYSGSLTSPGVLRVDDSLTSPSGQFKLLMQSDGNLVLYSFGDRSMWASFTSQPGSRLAVQSDGHLVIYNSANQSLWQSGTYGNNGARLFLQDDGNLVLRSLSGTLLWASYSSLSQIVVGEVLRTNYSLRSPNGIYKLVLQADGNLVLYNTATNPWQAIWYQHTYTAYPYAILQTDGNFVLYKGTGGSSFQTGTSGAMSRFALENDGRLVLYRSDNSIAWQSAPGTSGAFVVPATGRIFGYVGGYCDGTVDTGLPHAAWDISKTTGGPIYAAAAGTVRFSGLTSGNLGYRIVIEHDNGFETAYSHLQSDLQVNYNWTVSQGQLIGYMGNTGDDDYAVHLHFELRQNGTPLNSLNSYFYCGRDVFAKSPL
jgi:murein DD-endopeptidase MepM/ murein hydrolase activator NlpD